MSKNSFQFYISKISKTPLLTEQQEKELTTEYYTTKSKSIKDKLVAHNLRLVAQAAYKYSFDSENVSDLFQEGSIGLIRGIEKFDPTRGVRLGNYAYNWIKAYILRYITNNARTIKVGTTTVQRKLFFKLNQVAAKQIACGLESDEDLAKELGVKPQELQAMAQQLQHTANIDDKHDIATVDLDPSEVLENVEKEKLIGNIIPKFMNNLSERDRIIFQRRLLNDESDTLDSIGVDLSLTRERIRQIADGLKGQLKIFLKKNQIHGEL
jgi:RNA polymerase sigma-32 factor